MPEMMTANTPLTGAAHGKAGLALALGALQYTLNTDEADGRILELLKEEDQLYDHENNNWPDLRREDKRGFMSGWCSGAPGIGMYRKKLMEYTRNEEILEICQRDIELVSAYLCNCKESKRDTLCCGNASKLMAASNLGVRLPVLRRMLPRSAYPDAPRLYHMVNTGDHNIGLMQGMTGVAYALSMADQNISGEMLL